MSNNALNQLVTPTFLFLSTMSSISFALEPPIKFKKDNLQGDVNYLLSSSKATGVADKETQSLSGKLNYKRKRGEWGQEYRVEGVNSHSNNAAGNNIEIERYLGFAKGMRYLTDSGHYLFAKLQAEKDITTAFDYVLSPTVGYGHTLLKDERQSLIAEMAVGGQYLKNKLTGNARFEALATLGGEYRLKVNESVSFEQDLNFETSESLHTLRSRTALLTKLSDHISGQVSYRVKDANGNRIDTKDALTSVGIRYSR